MKKKEKTKEECYNEATLKSLGTNPQGTRQDVIHLAMDIYAKDQLKNKSTSLKEITTLINEYKKEELKHCDEPFHYEAEIAAGMKYFLEWLKHKNK